MTAAVAEEMLRVGGYRDVEQALRSPLLEEVAHPHAEHPTEGERVDFPLEGAIQALDGAPHLDRRRAYAGLFRRATLATYESERLLPVLRARLAALRPGSGPAEIAFDAVPVMRSAALHVAAAIIGIDGLDDTERESELLAISEALTEGGGVYWLTSGQAEVIQAARQARDRFMAAFGEPSLARRRDLVRRSKKPPREDSALLNDLASILAERGTGLLADQHIVNELTFFVVASFNTPTKVVPHVFVELDRWLARHPADRPRLGDPEYVRAAVLEALRLHVAAPILLRRAAAEVKLSSGLRIPAGSTVALELGAANRDPAVFGPDAGDYVLGREVPHGVPAYGMAFGSGSHKCIGTQLSIGVEGGGEAGAVAGMIVSFVIEFAQAGASLDAERPPMKRRDTVRDEYATCPMRLPAIATSDSA